MKLRQRESELSQDKEILLITDHSCVTESVKNYCAELRYQVEILEPINGVWEFYISKEPGGK
ncbi:MAG TPA: sulfurtransferase TusA family protein [Bacillota bacterium]|nr:sulfurtransferase TusA family protein [Bacillota bacterium]